MKKITSAAILQCFTSPRHHTQPFDGSLCSLTLLEVTFRRDSSRQGNAFCNLIVSVRSLSEPGSC